MSMSVLTPIFPVLSVLGGFGLGVLAALAFVLVLAAIRYRDFPRHLVERAGRAIFTIGVGSLLSFFIFRDFAGMPPFRITTSLAHIAIELIYLRGTFFLCGAAGGLLATLTVFLIGIAKGTRELKRHRQIHSPMRGVMPSWQ